MNRRYISVAEKRRRKPRTAPNCLWAIRQLKVRTPDGGSFDFNNVSVDRTGLTEITAQAFPDYSAIPMMTA